EDPQEDPEEESEEDPEEEPEEEEDKPEEAQQMDWRIQRSLCEMTEWAYDFYVRMLRIGAVGVRSSEAIDVLAVYGESQPPEPHGPPSGSH
nr:hypothetical protein [Tanacetum cinerariifolium]